MSERTASIRIEEDQQYPTLIFRAFLCENGMETPQILPCSFEGNQDVLRFFAILEQFLADGGTIKTFETTPAKKSA